MDDDERARLAEFVASRTPALLRVAYLLTGDRNAAEDLFQSALARTIPKWGTIRHADPEGYLRVVMYREQISWWRRLRRWRETPLNPADEPVGADPSSGSDVRLAMRAALRHLPPAQRAVVVSCPACPRPPRPGRSPYPVRPGRSSYPARRLRRSSPARSARPACRAE
ncbi:DNA-directed RNA polymerase specialized sigma subunit, sigma24 family [Micromonospora coriariae]|uniref:DNA-directed RNA polymerase specialized sigma subunit, sigma24 family n=1 Tax=Micromonospora coriariae TaxID=285665 RepID=A0A1C4WBY3_9ACTN|nr:sigma factor [Micromonospora coriariae]SCE93757.1 DNA-directed RNA polymerase specialized sigma subunit, sigma24 family [Micromonospora coriariae]